MHSLPEIVAHRGASAHAPEHSFAAYDLAIAMGADTLELDIRLTADGRLVVLHDSTLLRTAADPRAIDSVPFDDLPAVGGPPALDDVLTRYGNAVGWLVELKDPSRAMEAAVVRALARHRIDRATIQSFDHDSLLRIRSRAPIPVAPLIDERLPRSELLGQVLAARGWAVAVGVHHRGVDAGVVAAAHDTGLRVRAWTANAEADMERLLACEVDGLITDRPELARRVIEGRAMPAIAA